MTFVLGKIAYHNSWIWWIHVGGGGKRWFLHLCVGEMFVHNQIKCTSFVAGFTIVIVPEESILIFKMEVCVMHKMGENGG